MIKHKRVNLSMDKEVYKAVKKRVKNMSKYVENLVLKDLALNNNNTSSGVWSSNLHRPIFFQNAKIPM